MNYKQYLALKSQSEIAKELDVSQKTISNYLSGKIPSMEVLLKIAKLYNVSLDELCELDIGQSKKEEIKKFSSLKNKCYNILVSMTDEQVKLTYAYMLGLTDQDI